MHFATAAFTISNGQGPAVGPCAAAVAKVKHFPQPRLRLAPHQVEHGITEMITGVDLVAWQFELQVDRCCNVLQGLA